MSFPVALAAAVVGSLSAGNEHPVPTTRYEECSMRREIRVAWYGWQ